LAMGSVWKLRFFEKGRQSSGEAPGVKAWCGVRMVIRDP
jgi:hypothetical protein